jgi:FKBP-type peptidyl-prolyl cis-trans isomerase 2
MSLKEKDFIEIEFTGRVKDGEIFDSTLKEELEKLHSGHEHPVEAKPFVFCLGQEMFLKTLDDFLIGKETGKDYEIELEPEQAFGKRNTLLIQKIPLGVFIEKEVNPVPGAMFNFDGRIGKILTVSGGRTVVDFNHALAGKIVIYKIKVLRKITDLNEKIKALNEFFFRKELKFELKDKKLILKTDKSFVKFAELFKDKFKDILGLELEVKEAEDKKIEEKKEEKKDKKSQ